MEYTETIRASGESLLEIINAILDFSKIESGRMELESQPFEINHVVEEVVDLFGRLQASAKGVDLLYCVEPEASVSGPGQQAMHTRLRQVLSNLISNAIKFTTGGRDRGASCALGRGARPRRFAAARRN